MVSKVVSHAGGCGFPAGRTIDDIDDLHHADRTTPSDLHDRSLFRERGGASSRFSAEPWIVDFMGSPLGTHSVYVPRHPLWVDSPAGV